MTFCYHCDSKRIVKPSFCIGTAWIFFSQLLRGEVVTSRNSTNRGHANMAEKKKDMYDFSVHDCTREQTIAHTFLPSFDNVNCCFRQGRLLRSVHFVTMVTSRHTSPLYLISFKIPTKATPLTGSHI